MRPTPRLLSLAAVAVLATGCATTPVEPFDYTAFKQTDPKSILVLPPTHSTPNVRATNSVLAQVTLPLAESGFYVMPVSLVTESLKQNGVTQPADAHNIPLKKLHEVFGADAVLYLNVTEYGTSYRLIDSVTTVAVDAKLVSSLTGDLLWKGSARASSAEQQNQQQGGLVGMLLTAVVKQIVSTMRDESHPMAGLATQRLLAAGRTNGMLFGPRSPQYKAKE
jgi:hypothetical protein